MAKVGAQPHRKQWFPSSSSIYGDKTYPVGDKGGTVNKSLYHHHRHFQQKEYQGQDTSLANEGQRPQSSFFDRPTDLCSTGLTPHFYR